MDFFVVLLVNTSLVLGRMQRIKHHDGTLALAEECKVHVSVGQTVY